METTTKKKNTNFNENKIYYSPSQSDTIVSNEFNQCSIESLSSSVRFTGFCVDDILLSSMICAIVWMLMVVLMLSALFIYTFGRYYLLNMLSVTQCKDLKVLGIREKVLN